MTKIDMCAPVGFGGASSAVKIISDKRDGDGAGRSTGTIIGSNCVLTCAHSVVKKDGSVIPSNDVYVCFPNRSKDANGRVVDEWRSGNCRVLKFPDYDAAGEGFRYDLAIIRFNDRILRVGDDPKHCQQPHIHTVNARRLPVVTPQQFRTASDPSNARVEGFGSDPHNLTSLDCRFWKNFQSGTFYNKTTLNHTGQTQGGDSGGALVLVGLDCGPVQVGVHSIGQGAAGYDPERGSVAARLDLPDVQDWIKEHCC